MKRASDTEIYRDHDCELCHKPVLLSKGDGYWRNRGGVVTAWHISCLYPIRKVA